MKFNYNIEHSKRAVDVNLLMSYNNWSEIHNLTIIYDRCTKDTLSYISDLISLNKLELAVKDVQIFKSHKEEKTIYISKRYKTIFYLSNERNDIEYTHIYLYHYEDSHLISEFNKLKTFEPDNSDKSYVSILCRSNGSFYTKSYKFNPINLNLSMNYNDDFINVNKKTLESLRDKKSGLYLLHGLPGTGKSSYIKYLMKELHDKRLYIITSDKINYFKDDDFIDYINKIGKDSIFIIEDAEELLRKREENRYFDVVSTLLNLSDGIIGSLLNIKIICTFNGREENIDEALLRKGRLSLKYKFELLSSEKSQALSNFLGFKSKIDKPMSLADIYNQDVETGYVKEERKRVGF